MLIFALGTCTEFTVFWYVSMQDTLVVKCAVHSALNKQMLGAFTENSLRNTECDNVREKKTFSLDPVANAR